MLSVFLQNIPNLLHRFEGQFHLTQARLLQSSESSRQSNLNWMSDKLTRACPLLPLQ